MPRLPAVFIDRDDTILETTRATARDPVPGDLYDPARATLLPGAAEAVALLADAGFAVVVFTSQGGVARGSGALRDCERVNDAMRAMIDRAAGRSGLVTAVYFCPFHPTGCVAPFVREHPWRKPGPGMVAAAADELGIDLARSWAIGDKPRDREAAVNAGIARERTVLVGCSGEPRADVADLLAAARAIAG